jgi:hypothetical protein
MNDKTGRRWFQIHLSTAIVLMIAAAGLLFVNMHRDIEQFAKSEQQLMSYVYLKFSQLEPNKNYAFVRVRHGWPLNFQDAILDEPQFEVAWREPSWNYWNLAADAGIAFGILGMIVMFCEWQIRRRTREKNE